MRKALQKIKSNQYRVFTGRIYKIAYEKYMVKDIQVYDESGNTIIGYVDHCLLAKKPFKNCYVGDKVRFTGTVKPYVRRDGSQDYLIIVNKARAI